MKYFDCQPADRPAGDEQKEDTLKMVTEPWSCQWGYDGAVRQLFVPFGYLYDGASVPRVFWSLIGLWPDGLIRAAALAHDVLYRAAGGAKPEAWGGCVLTNDAGSGVIVTRKEADWLLQEYMKTAGMWKHRCGLAWVAVRIGGARHWGGPMPTIKNKRQRGE